MAEDTRPALSAEEWQRCRYERGDFCAFCLPAPGAPLQMRLWGRLARVSLPSARALAALALHRQDYGFTRQDVDLLRKGIDSWRPTYQEEERLRSLADRIEALLPPRSLTQEE